MSHFYVSSKGDCNKMITRRAHNHATTHIRSWSAGIEVNVERLPTGDKFSIFLTGGSGRGGSEFLGSIVCDLAGRVSGAEDLAEAITRVLPRRS